jgi:hypothetical protein
MNKILVVSNRQVTDESATDETLFGEQLNEKGAAEIRLAWAKFKNRKWILEIIPEPDELTMDTLPSRNAFIEFRDILQERNRDGLFFIPGFNQSFLGSLQQSRQLQQRYKVGVIIFSWPSNPGGFIIDEYQMARAIAKISNVALDRILEKIGRYIKETIATECGISFNLMMHSLGNFLFQGYIEVPIFTGETRFFDNIVLHQADVDNQNHASWVDRLRYATRVYITINERDAILDASDIINPNRLGNTVRKLNAKRAKYINFTNANNVKFDHEIFGDTADRNDNIKDFFERAFSGEKAHEGTGIAFNKATNSYEVA